MSYIQTRKVGACNVLKLGGHSFDQKSRIDDHNSPFFRHATHILIFAIKVDVPGVKSWHVVQLSEPWRTIKIWLCAMPGDATVPEQGPPFRCPRALARVQSQSALPEAKRWGRTRKMYSRRRPSSDCVGKLTTTKVGEKLVSPTRFVDAVHTCSIHRERGDDFGNVPSTSIMIPPRAPLPSSIWRPAED